MPVEFSYQLPAVTSPLEWRHGQRPLVMGVVNITPDSFSDGGHFFTPEDAISHGLQLAEEGADILDLGAESTRPGGGVYGAGMDEVDAKEEIRRLDPVIKALRSQLPDMPLSVDTRKGAVAAAALEAGADIVNDVGGLRDPELVRAAALTRCPLIAMHSRGQLADMQREIHFEDVLAEVAAELEACRRRATQGGVDPQRVILDPGIGFGKKLEHNLLLIGGLDRLAALGQPLLLGASRKSFISAIRPAPATERLGGSLAALAFAARQGAQFVRVHDVAASIQFLEVFEAVSNAIDSERP